MESVLSSDDSCEETLNLKNQLIDYGFEEDNLSKEEMMNLLVALKYSKSTEQEEELLRNKVETSDTTPKGAMKRRYTDVRDRRLPWCLFPPDISAAEKARLLAVYIKLMSINSYRQARLSSNLAAWPPPMQIAETSRIKSSRSTRSGRSVPIYSGFDEDSSDFDCVVTKTKKRKVSNSDMNDATYSDKVISLKRKTSKDECIRPIKEAKITDDPIKNDSKHSGKLDLLSLID